MSKSKKPPSNHAAGGPLRATLVVAGLLIYCLLYYRAPLPSLAAIEEGLSRGTFLFRSFLLLDEVVGDWFGDPAELSFADRLPVLFVAASILTVGWLLGRLVLQGLRLDAAWTRLESFVFAIGAGLNCVSLAVLALGLTVGTQSLRGGLIIAGVLVATLALGQFYRSKKVEPLAQPARVACGEDWLSLRGAWLVVPFALLIVLGGLMPPVEFDVREYHLQAPKEFYQQGQITFLPHNVYANMPLGAEMFALLGMILTGDWWTGALVGKTVIALFAPLTALALYAAGRRWFTPSAGILAAVAYLSTPWIARVSNLGLIEGALAFYTLLALYGVWLWWDAVAQESADDEKNAAQRILLLAGFLAGAAVSCKYTGLPFVVLPLGAWILLGVEKVRWRSALVFSLAVIVGCGLWFGKNWVLTGNPTYPLLANVFGGETRTAEKNDQWRAAHHAKTFTLTDAAEQAANVTWRSEWHSPLLVPLVVLAWLLRCRRRAMAWLWAYLGVVLLIWWGGTHRLDRFWLPIMPVLALLAGAGATWTAERWWRYSFYALLGVGLLGNFLLIAQPTGGYTQFFVSYERLRNDPARVNRAHLYLNEHVPEGSRALLIGDAQVFDLEVPILYNTVFDHDLFEQIAAGRSPEEIHAALAARRISHLYVHWGEIVRYRSPGNYGFTDFIQPEVFERLVEAGVLQSEPLPEETPGEIYRVLPTQSQTRSVSEGSP